MCIFLYMHLHTLLQNNVIILSYLLGEEDSGVYIYTFVWEERALKFDIFTHFSEIFIYDVVAVYNKYVLWWITYSSMRPE